MSEPPISPPETHCGGCCDDQDCAGLYDPDVHSLCIQCKRAARAWRQAHEAEVD